MMLFLSISIAQQTDITQAQEFNSPVPPFVSHISNIRHEGDLILEKDELFEIRNCEYTQIGNIIVRDRATLIVENATLIIIKPSYYYDYGITIKDSAHLIIDRSNLTSVRHNLLGIPGKDHIKTNLFDSSRTTIKDSVVSAYILIYNSSYIHISNSNIFSPSFDVPILIHDFSSTYIESSSITGIAAYDYSSAVITSSINPWLLVRDSSKVLVKDSSLFLGLGLKEASLELTFSGGYTKYWNPHIDGTIKGADFNLTLINTDIKSLSISAVNSIIKIVNSSSLRDIWMGGNSSCYIINCTVGIGYYESGTIESYDSSSIFIINSTVGRDVGVSSRGLSIFIEYSSISRIGVHAPTTIINSSISRIEHYSGKLSVVNSTIIEGIVKCYSDAFIINSQVNRINAESKSNITLVNTQVNSLAIFDEAVVYKKWYLLISVTLNNKTCEGAYVEVYDINGFLISNGTTGYDGKIIFILPEYIMKSHMEIKYVGNYVIKVTYDGISGQENVILNTNKKVPINLLGTDVLPKNFTEIQTKYEMLNASYHELLLKYATLKDDYESIKSKYDVIQKEYDSLKNEYNILKAKYDDLMTKAKVLPAIPQELVYILIITTMVFIFATIYFARRKPKAKPAHLSNFPSDSFEYPRDLNLP
jgi:hypothetical protein